MTKTLLTKLSMIAAVALTTNAYAFQFEKPVTIKATVTKGNVGTQKDVTVMGVKLSSKERTALASYQPAKNTLLSKSNNLYPVSHQLDMSKVPVLDQGKHGACVTFATTAAVNATLGQGDYISQLCNLSLGLTLQKDSYYGSGWDGAFGNEIFDQMLRFGVVKKDKESNAACGGLTAYPASDKDQQGTGITTQAFKEISENVSEKFYVVQHMNWIDRFIYSQFDEKQGNKVLDKVKGAISSGHYVTFGTLLKMSFYCGGAACAKHSKDNDTWANSKTLDKGFNMYGGHEMVIIGYDDIAEATDDTGVKHRGLLTLRNSWGSEVGDNGNFYMTYDYFKRNAMEVYEIVPVSGDNLS